MPKKQPMPVPPAVLIQIERELTPRFLIDLTQYAERACGRLLSMLLLGWELPSYTNVRRRLDTLMRRIPDELRAAAIEVLTRDGGAALGIAGKRAADASNAAEWEDDTDGFEDAGEPFADDSDEEDPT